MSNGARKKALTMAGVFPMMRSQALIAKRRIEMKLQPLNDWAVIKPAAAEEKSAGGIIIPDTAQEKPQEGVVEAIGPGAYEEEKSEDKKKDKKERQFVPTSVKPGERVLYQRYAGTTYTIGAEELVLVREKDILGILTEK
jgi:chaperonin GroES